MDDEIFFEELHQRIAKYDLLCHPFYQAWSAGELTPSDLREYAAEYYHQVAAFPTYLSALHSRLPDGNLRRAVLRNLCDEEIEGSAHSDLWLDFAEGMGNRRDQVRERKPIKQVRNLMETFRRIAGGGSTAAALAALYAYESQVPQIAKVKECGLRELYGADERSSRYFAVHKTADVHHAHIWREALKSVLGANPEIADEALNAAEDAATALWHAVDGIDKQFRASN